MIIGKNSVWKMLALFALVLLAVLDLIFCDRKVVYVLNALLMALSIMAGVVKLYLRWSAKS